MTKNIIITGGAGFIGYHLSEKLLKKNFKIIIIDNLSRGKYDNDLKKLLKNKNIKFIRFDLTKKLKINIQNPDYIFHLAGSVGVENIYKNAFNSLSNNILTLKNIIDYNNNLKKKAKLIIFSTSEVYSPLIKKKRVKFPIKEDNEIIIENEIIERDAYYISKIFNEKLAQFSNADYLILRPHNIYGPRMGYSHVIPELITKMIYEKKKLTNNTLVLSPTHKRAFCFIDDAIKQIIKLSLSKKINNSVYNIGNMREEISMLDLAMKIKKLFFLESKLKKGSFTKGSPERRVPDMNKTEKTIKVFKYINLQEGLKITLNWYLLNFKKNLKIPINQKL